MGGAAGSEEISSHLDLKREGAQPFSFLKMREK